MLSFILEYNSTLKIYIKSMWMNKLHSEIFGNRAYKLNQTNKPNRINIYGIVFNFLKILRLLHFIQ